MAENNRLADGRTHAQEPYTYKSSSPMARRYMPECIRRNTSSLSIDSRLNEKRAEVQSWRRLDFTLGPT